MNMQDQEPSVSDILSSIRQILSDKIETEANVSASDGVDDMSADNVMQLKHPTPVSDDEVFVLTAQMRVPEKNISVQNERNEQKSFSVSDRVNEDNRQQTVVSQSAYDSQSAVRFEAEDRAHNYFDSDMPVQGIDIKPMVQAWLDKNLPQIVEKIVSEEVRRIFNKR